MKNASLGGIPSPGTKCLKRQVPKSVVNEHKSAVKSVIILYIASVSLSLIYSQIVGCSVVPLLWLSGFGNGFDDESLHYMTHDYDSSASGPFRVV